MPTEPEIKLLEPDACLSRWRNVVVIVYRQSPTFSTAQRISALLAPLSSERPRSIAKLLIIEESCGLPAQSAREEFARSTERIALALSGVAVVPEGDGFHAAAARSVVTGIGMLVRQSRPLKIFALMGPAIEWLCATAPGLEVAELNEAVASVRRACAAGTPARKNQPGGA